MRTRSFFMIMLLSISGGAFGVPSFEHRCNNELPKANLAFHMAPVTYKVFNNVSTRLLSQRGTYTYASELLLGMIESKSVLEIEFDGTVLQDTKRKTECLSPRIDVFLRYEPLKVYIARELPLGSCPYRVMYDHEMFHVQVYQEQLPLIREKVERALSLRFENQKLYSPIGQSKGLLEQEIDSRWRPLIREELSKIEKMQREFDSREEIYRLSNSCFGETSKLMGSLY
jgi:hypothetical protein